MKTELIKPSDLPHDRIHSPEEIAAHKDAVSAYFEAKNAAEKRQAEAQEQAEAKANRLLSPAEYFEFAVQRFEEAKAKDAARRLQQVEAEVAEAAYMASLPDVAEVTEASESHFLSKLQSWFAKGYQLQDDSLVHFIRGCYAVRLYKPAKPKK